MNAKTLGERRHDEQSEHVPTAHDLVAKLVEVQSGEATAPGRSRTAKKILFALLSVSLLLHFVNLAHPRQVIFDEVHFGKFVTAYCCTGENIFDIHPPHAKLLIAGMAYLNGYRGGFDFSHIGEKYQGIRDLSLRFFPAIWGSLIPCLMFILLLQLGASTAAALLGGIMVLLDNALLLQTRVIALDGLLLLGTLGTLSSYLASYKASSYLRKVKWLLFCGVCAAAAVGTKFTGLAAFVLPGIVFFCKTPGAIAPKNVLRLARQYVWILSAAVPLYLFGWYAHFHLLTKPGFGDQFYRTTGHFLWDVVHLHKTMFSANYHLAAHYANESPWWSWPIMKRSIFYWTEPQRYIYFLGNPVVWWGSFAGVLIALFSRVSPSVSIKIKETVAQRRIDFAIPVLAYLASYLPYAPIPRGLFLYHYLPPLMFSILASVLFLDQLGWTSTGALIKQRRSYFFALGLIVLGFLCIAPLTYGTIVPNWYAELIFGTFPNWR